MTKQGKPRSRANGEGSVFKSNKSGSYTAQYTAPDGKRHSKTFSLQREAREWLTEQRSNMDTGDYVKPSMMLLKDWWSKWVEVYKKRKVGDASLDTYKYTLARLPQKMQNTPISEITKADIQQALNGLTDDGKGYRTVKMTRANLMMCFKQAVEDKLIRFNPVVGTVLPDDDQMEAVPLNKEEYDSLMAKLTRPLRVTAKGLVDQNDLIRQAIRDAILLILKTGLRRQECVDLEWMDWNGSWLHVRGTKTDDADRMIPITDPDALDMLKRRQGYGGKYIFSTRHGTPLHATALLKFMKRETGHTVHELRHTFITNAARAGIRAEVLMTITGHRDLETLLQVYTHVNDQDKLDAVEKLSSYCKPTANSESKPTSD